MLLYKRIRLTAAEELATLVLDKLFPPDEVMDSFPYKRTISLGQGNKVEETTKHILLPRTVRTDDIYRIW